MPTFDPFTELAKRWSVVTIHNVKLLDVSPDEGFERLVIEHEGQQREVSGGGRWSDTFSRRDVGRHGYLVPVPVRPYGNDDGRVRAGACYFRAYVDPSLRRVPELDAETGERGWLCDDYPGGLLAPPRIIPGQGGQFVRDETIEVTVRVPPEFVRECRRVQRTPAQILEGFIGDLAGVQNYVNCPRADGFGSNGSDEREMADAWLQRAYGMDAIDVDAAEAVEEEEKERQLERDDFGAMLDQFIDYGGSADELRTAVEALVEQRRVKSNEAST